MYYRVKKIVGLILSLSIILSLTIPVLAASPRANEYITYTEARITKTGSGSFSVEFDVDATRVMKELGAKEITIYEQQSNGTYEEVKTFTRYNTSGLIDTNVITADGGVTYGGTVGTRYYATVAIYAKDASGSETLYCDTKIITA